MSLHADAIEQLVLGELLVFPPGWVSGRLGHTSQVLRSRGYTLRTRKEDDGLYAWAEYSGKLEPLRKRHHK